MTCEQAVLVKGKELLILSSLDGVKAMHLKLTAVQRGRICEAGPALPRPVLARFTLIKIVLAAFRGQNLILISWGKSSSGKMEGWGVYGLYNDGHHLWNYIIWVGGLILEVMCFRNVWGIFRQSFQFTENGKILYIRFKNGQESRKMQFTETGIKMTDWS